MVGSKGGYKDGPLSLCSCVSQNKHILRSSGSYTEETRPQEQMVQRTATGRHLHCAKGRKCCFQHIHVCFLEDKQLTHFNTNTPTHIYIIYCRVMAWNHCCLSHHGSSTPIHQKTLLFLTEPMVHILLSVNKCHEKVLKYKLILFGICATLYIFSVIAQMMIVLLQMLTFPLFDYHLLKINTCQCQA